MRTLIAIAIAALLPPIAVAQTPRSLDDKGRQAIVSLDSAPLPRHPAGLDLSGITPLLKTPAQPEPTSRSSSLSSSRTDLPEESGSSSIEPILRKIPSDVVPPTLYKGENFLRDHRFGVELQTPF